MNIGLIYVKEPDVLEPVLSGAAVVAKDDVELWRIEEMVRSISKRARSEGDATPQEVWSTVTNALEDAGYNVIFHRRIVVETERLTWLQLPLFQ